MFDTIKQYTLVKRSDIEEIKYRYNLLRSIVKDYKKQIIDQEKIITNLESIVRDKNKEIEELSSDRAIKIEHNIVKDYDRHGRPIYYELSRDNKKRKVSAEYAKKYYKGE